MPTMLTTPGLQPFAIQESVQDAANEVNGALALDNWVVLTREDGSKFAVRASDVHAISERSQAA